MSDEMKEFIKIVAEGKSLSEQEAEKAFEVIMSGNATAAQIGAFLMALRMRGETVEEITGAAKIMRAKALGINAPADAIDTCGTGGDASGTYNISTGCSIVVAACGVPVAKHGNKALSSKSGSADVLSALGVNIDADMELVEKAISDVNIGFMMAPRHHSAMKYVGPARVEMGVRTIFNLLGPLANPAKTKRQMIGVFDKQWVKPIAEVLGRLGAEKAWAVYGSDGLDEITTTGITYVAEYANGTVNEFEISPEEFGISIAKPEDLKGGDAVTNAKALQEVYGGAKNALRDVIVLNAAAALVVADKVADLKQGVEMAANAIDSGKAAETLQKLVDITNGK
jgi:anthranilate phosphoribosyltransferase